MSLGTVTYPGGRAGPWRLTLHPRTFAAQAKRTTVLYDLVEARSRKLTQAWNASAELTFTLDGRGPAAAELAELEQDVCAWRIDEATGSDYCAFRGVLSQSEDELSEQTHTVTLTCHDYFAMLDRRYVREAAGLTYTQQAQDAIAGALLTYARAPGGATFTPGAYLPLALAPVTPGGSARAVGGPLRDRAYTGSTSVGQALDDLARVQGGYDYDVLADTVDEDALRIFYPWQGLDRGDVVLAYGANVAGITRSLNSTTYGNYVRVLGQSDPSGPQLAVEAYNLAEANNVGQTPLGLWMGTDAAADVSDPNTLTQQAAGWLATNALVPSYTVTLRPGVWHRGYLNMGDVVDLVVKSGRLDVEESVRVLGITYDIGDDGTEDVELTVGRPARTLTDLLNMAARNINALNRR